MTGAESQEMRLEIAYHFLELAPPELFPSCTFQVNSKISRSTIELWIHPLTYWWCQNPLSFQKTHPWALHVVSFWGTFHIHTIKASPFQNQNLKCYKILKAVGTDQLSLQHWKIFRWLYIITSSLNIPYQNSLKIWL